MLRRVAVRNLVTTSMCNPNRLKGKTAVVTGSSYGIGFNIAERLARDGANVAICSRDEANVKSALEQLKGLSVIGVKCHVAKADERKKLFEETAKTFGGIDILIANAAVNPTPAIGPVFDVNEDSWDKIFEVNVKSSFLLGKEALPFIRKRGGGSIVFVSSIVGVQPLVYLGAYSVSKTALLGLTKSASLHLANENIRVNCIAPGPNMTKFLSKLYANKELRQRTIDAIPMGRFGEPSDIGGVAAFLVSDDASYITGETIVVAGGMQSRL